MALNPSAPCCASVSSPEVRAAAAEDDPVNFEVHVTDSDHGVAQRSLQKELLKDVIWDGAHVSNVAQKVSAADEMKFESWSYQRMQELSANSLTSDSQCLKITKLFCSVLKLSQLSCIFLNLISYGNKFVNPYAFTVK